MKFLLLKLTSLLLVVSANANNLVIGTPAHGGTGCPQTSSYVHNNGRRILFLFDQFQIDGQNSSSSFARSACNIRVPISPPAGYKMVVREALTEGVYNVEPGDQVTLDQEVWFVGQTGRNPVKETLTGSWNYVDVGHNRTDKVIAESACGKDAILALAATGMIRKSSAASTETYLGVYKTELEIQLVPCQ